MATSALTNRSPSGYRDGVRNVRDSDRLRVVYVHTEGGQPEEPRWADGGTYMVNMKIAQNRAAFSSLPDDGTRDTVIGRLKDGTRLDLKGANDDPHEEPSDVPELLPPNAHVRKAGPRGQHDDTEIFRRGLPYADVVNGRVEVGLHFCSFQATAAQFDTVFNDWMLNQLFPQRPDGSIPGIDALMSTATAHGPLVEVRHAGIFFVPPYDQDGLAAALTAAAGPSRRRTGRLAINKVVVSPGNPGKRFERGGFTFEVRDSAGKTTVPNSQFTTQTNGRGVCQADLTVGETYQLVEVSTPRPVEPTEPIIFSMDKPNKHLRVENRIVEPNPGYTV
ncbi:Dyp-type peroxidase domain-containing protein [Nocardioides sp.]|uniref:Dyp-type peroxidase n=1 Tax=Nocardioides sp. TaxID=35761 RepID=UPI0026286C8C|nr:Dyp-type peroxidase domain-containing protein [Nocardioides sp.]